MSVAVEQSKPFLTIEKAIQAERCPHAVLLLGNSLEKNLELADCIAKSFLDTTVIASHPDVYRLEPENQTITVDSVRELITWSVTSSHSGHGKVCLVHPAHAMNKAAMNAILKTLEEPPANVLFILICEKPSLLLPTIKSRCQVLHGFNDDNDDCVKDLAWQKTLDGFLTGRFAPVEFAKFCVNEKLELSEVLLVLQWVVVDCIRAQSGLQPLHFNVTAYASKKSLAQWYKLLDRVTHYQSLIFNKFNLNSELALDEIFIMFARA